MTSRKHYWGVVMGRKSLSMGGLQGGNSVGQNFPFLVLAPKESVEEETYIVTRTRCKQFCLIPALNSCPLVPTGLLFIEVLQTLATLLQACQGCL